MEAIRRCDLVPPTGRPTVGSSGRWGSLAATSWGRNIGRRRYSDAGDALRARHRVRQRGTDPRDPVAAAPGVRAVRPQRPGGPGERPRRPGPDPRARAYRLSATTTRSSPTPCAASPSSTTTSPSSRPRSSRRRARSSTTPARGSRPTVSSSTLGSRGPISRSDRRPLRCVSGRADGPAPNAVHRRYPSHGRVTRPWEARRSSRGRPLRRRDRRGSPGDHARRRSVHGTSPQLER
jgi:hypothetical protein